MRRRLIFNIPPGKEEHYSKIQGGILGPVWAPLYHSYSYYMPANNVRQPHFLINQSLWNRSTEGAWFALFAVLVTGVFGWNALIRAAVGSVVWSEAESVFATWDGHVTFGTSHITAHAGGFFLFSAVREILTSKKLSWLRILLLGLSFVTLPDLIVFVGIWVRDGFSPVSVPVSKGMVHRIDNVAHIGGILTGFLNAYFLKNR